MGKESEPRVGVYVCHCGGNISDVVDVQKVAEEAGRLPGVVVARTNMFMCSDPGQQLIQEDIAKEGLNRVVVASCSPRLHVRTFRGAIQRAGLNPYLYEHANIREQVSWVTHAHPAEATAKASRLVAVAVAKARQLEPLEPVRVDARRQAVVIGGGVSGLKAAADLAATGIGVMLIEKSPFLGGHMVRLDKVYPTGEDAVELLDPLIEQVIGDPNVEVLTNSEVIGAEGYVGDFRLKVRRRPRGVLPGFAGFEEVEAACPVEVSNEHDYGLTNRKAIYRPSPDSQPGLPAIDWQACNRCGRCAEVAELGIDLEMEPTVLEINVGVVVVATGFEHYEPARGESGYLDSPAVITLPQLISWTAQQPADGKELRWQGRPVRNLALIHCVGSRQIEGIHEPKDGKPLNEYCSRVCCTATLQAATELRERFPNLNIFDFYRDIRTYGRGHEAYYENASRQGVLFFRYAAETPPEVVQAGEGADSPLVVKVKDLLTWGEELEVLVDLVVLAVGMVPHGAEEITAMLKLAVGTDGYLLEVHPKLRPVEVAVNGVLLAGTSQGPKDITESAAAASAAAAKAAVLLSKGYVELEPFVAAVDPAKCDGCGECLAVCGYEGTLTMVASPADPERQVATINPALCKGCGACAAVCPQQAIAVQGSTLDQFDAMVDAICADDLAVGATK
ncbi:MAG: CoB--CoM heterodisulfide reductase iron-sulfur subunit A family protein [Dehalococcoidales bacterium]|nr:CoB--CoM heterodisulfide reductase iron-sulfur subunit A family protein [Dehalococcoidales bacterium]